MSYQRSAFSVQLSKLRLKLDASHGFSLLELLVVISIVTILITLSMSSLATAGKKGRDAKRKSDIREIKNALEQYYSVCGFVYPEPPGAFYTEIICPDPNIAIMPQVPTDPRGGAAYYCGGTCDYLGYTICADLEAENPVAFCVSNSQ